mmetsp:Transcript_34206/g.75870  ORF Transcript_34206/g.75870 Transcript_34206/m.75870 type:complete len:96 (+) Transcript_34206:193-480(+)
METIKGVSMLISAVGTLAAGTGVLMIGFKSETLAKEMASEGLREGLKGHMSAPDAGRQFGQAASSTRSNTSTSLATLGVPGSSTCLESKSSTPCT